MLRYIHESLPVPDMPLIQELGRFSEESGVMQVMRAAIETHGRKSLHHNYEKTLVGEDVGPEGITRPFYTTVHNRIDESGQITPYLFHAYTIGGPTRRTTRSMMLPLREDGELEIDTLSRYMVNWHIQSKGTIKLEYYANNLKRIAGLMADAIESQPPAVTLDGVIAIKRVAENIELEKPEA
jgi:hypothetical protein